MTRTLRLVFAEFREEPKMDVLFIRGAPHGFAAMECAREHFGRLDEPVEIHAGPDQRGDYPTLNYTVRVVDYDQPSFGPDDDENEEEEANA